MTLITVWITLNLHMLTLNRFAAEKQKFDPKNQALST